MPRSCGSSHSSSGDPTNSPDTPSNSTSAAQDAAHNSDRANSSAQLDTMSSSHPGGDSTSGSLPPVGRHPPEDPAALQEAVSRALQEFMLSHDAADIIEPLQVCSLHC